MKCSNCDDTRGILICKTCGNEASSYFDHNTGDLYESCEDCESNGLEPFFDIVPCPKCSKEPTNESSGLFNIELESHIAKFTKEYGEIKLEKIIKKLSQSNNIRKTIDNFKLAKAKINSKQILTVVGSLTYFIFHNKTDLKMGCIIFLYIWNKDCNEAYGIMTENELFEVLQDVIKITSKQLY